MEARTSATTHLSTRSGDAPLTEEAILDQYGPLMWAATVAFTTDPSYFEAMALMANEVDLRRAEGERRRSASRECR